MDNYVKNRIEEFARDVHLTFNVPSPIMDMKDAVKKMGGIILEDESMNTFDEGIVKKENEKEVAFSIRIPKTMPESRRNFAIAKCLGRLFLFMGYAINEDLWNGQEWENASREERLMFEVRANEFAAAFLMPREEYKRVIRKNTRENKVFLKPVADHFNVSAGDVSYRGKDLDVLERF